MPVRRLPPAPLRRPVPPLAPPLPTLLIPGAIRPPRRHPLRSRRQQPFHPIPARFLEAPVLPPAPLAQPAPLLLLLRQLLQPLALPLPLLAARQRLLALLLSGGLALLTSEPPLALAFPLALAVPVARVALVLARALLLGTVSRSRSGITEEVMAEEKPFALTFYKNVRVLGIGFSSCLARQAVNAAIILISKELDNVTVALEQLLGMKNVE